MLGLADVATLAEALVAKAEIGDAYAIGVTRWHPGMQSLTSCCRRRGIDELRGEVLEGNLRMQRLAKHPGFQLTTGAGRLTFGCGSARRKGSSFEPHGCAVTALSISCGQTGKRPG